MKKMFALLLLLLLPAPLYAQNPCTDALTATGPFDSSTPIRFATELGDKTDVTSYEVAYFETATPTVPKYTFPLALSALTPVSTAPTCYTFSAPPPPTPGSFVAGLRKLINTTASPWTFATTTVTIGTPPPPPPTPVDCVASAWATTTTGAWSICAASSQTRAVIQTRSIVTPASNGGSMTACTPLTQSIIETQACIDPPPPPPGCTTFPQIFVGGPRYTTGKPGSLTNVDYVITSPSEIFLVEALVNGNVVAVGGSGAAGANVGKFSALQFTMPARGTYTLEIRATNACGVRKAASPIDLRVK